MNLLRALRTASGVAALAIATSCATSTDGGPVPTDIILSPSPVTLSSVGQTQALSVQVLDQDGAPISGVTPTWSSQNTLVVTVSAGGVVTAVANGTTTVTASVGALSNSVTVTVAQVPSQAVKTGGDGQSGLVSTALAQPIRLRVNDFLGNPVSGVTVAFAVTSGSGGVSSPTAITNGFGEASVTWTLGPGSGAQSATATVQGTALSQVFGATASLANVAFVAGAGQTALVGFATNFRPAVLVSGAGGAPLPGINVSFAVTGGGGSVSTPTVTSNASGIAQVGAWIMGGSPGTNTLSASVGGDPPVSITATAQNAAYTIEVRNIGPAFSTEVQTAFDAAVTYWQQIIYGDQSDVSINTTNACGLGATINEVVDDLIILARFEPIDGVGGVLGSAGACSIRVSNGLPIYGQMRFDTDDVAALITNGTLNAVILHEMGHVLGFSVGIINTQAGITEQRLCAQLLTAAGAPQDTHFNCSHPGATNLAMAAFDSMGGTSYTGGFKVPLENCVTGVPDTCGAGNFNSHWREHTFFNELMTGYLNNGVANPMSVLTIALFADMGYRVNFAAAQPYSRTFTAPAVASGTVVDLTNDLYSGPVDVVDDRTGVVVRVIQPE
jgi:hypothetical protein